MIKGKKGGESPGFLIFLLICITVGITLIIEREVRNKSSEVCFRSESGDVCMVRTDFERLFFLNNDY